VTLLAIALIFGAYVGEQQHWFASSPSYPTEIISFLGVSMATIFYFLNRRLGSPSFVQAYLISITVKMLAYGVFILIIILMDRMGAIPNVILFMVSYLLFTVVEVGFLFRAVNK
jgi:hypothetical protein